MNPQPELSVRQSTLLMFLDGDPAVTLDPVRVMKGLFLLAQRVPTSWLDAKDRYEFEPYHYGPFSADIYTDIGILRRLGLVECHEVLGQTWCRYSLTYAGHRAAESAAENADPRLVDHIGKLRSWVGSLSFNELLTAVYDAFPYYAKNSVFNR